MTIVHIEPWRLALGYLLLLIPLGVMLWYSVGILSRTMVAMLRMTVQLLFVGLYLKVVFEVQNPLLTGAWLAVMILVADVTVLRGCRMRLRAFLVPMFLALLAGTLVPLVYFLWVILSLPYVMDAQYFIPIAGMILGNCLRADLIGIRSFYESVQTQEAVYLQALGQGARRGEALRPFVRNAIESALSPTVATIATIGLVSLPGMMTGVILGGAEPMQAIKYQIAIMLAIFTGTAITVLLAIWLTVRWSFDDFGVLRKECLRSRSARK